jgi:hypothetical protein
MRRQGPSKSRWSEAAWLCKGDLENVLVWNDRIRTDLQVRIQTLENFQCVSPVRIARHSEFFA